MLLYITTLLFFGCESNCREESLRQMLNKFKYDVSYKRIKVQKHLKYLAKNNQKELALGYLDSAQKQLLKEQIINHTIATAIHAPLTFVYPLISYCNDGIIALSENQACSSIVNENCPHLFHIENELYWHILRGQNTMLRVSLMLGLTFINVYNYSNRLRKHNTLSRSCDSILSSMRHEVESKKIKFPVAELNYIYTPLLIDAMNIHEHNFNKVWFNSVRKNIKKMYIYDHSLALECADILKNNLEQDRRNRFYFSAGLVCFMMFASYTQAILSYLNDEEPSIYNRHIQDGHYYNLYAMAPLSPFLMVAFCHEAIAPVNHKLDVLARFKESLINQ